MTRDISILCGETVITAAYTYSETYERALMECLAQIYGDNLMNLPDELTSCAQALFREQDKHR